MKTFRHLFFLLPLFFVSQTASAQSNVIKAQAGYTGFTLQNKGDHIYHFEITDKNGDTQHALLNPYQSWSPKPTGKKWSRGEVRKSVVTATYSEEAYLKEKAEIENAYRNKVRGLDQWRDRNESALNDEIVIRAAAVVASSVDTRSDAGWFENLLRGGIKLSGQIVTFAYDVRDFMYALEQAQYKSWDELIYDTSVSLLQQEARKAAARQIARYLDLDEEPTDDMLKVMAHYIGVYTEIETTYEEYLGKYQRQKDKDLSGLEAFFNSTQPQTMSLADLDYQGKPFNFEMSLALQPLNYGNRLNDFWKGHPERFLVEDPEEEDNYDFYDAFWNRNLAAKARMSISPSVRFLKVNHRLFITGGYTNNYYDHDRKDGYSLSTDFFATTGQGNFTARFPIVYELQQWHYGLTYRLSLTRTVALEADGGYLQQKGALNFKYAELSEDFSWKEDRITEVTNEEKTPYYGGSILLGDRRRSKLMFYASYHTFSSSLAFTDDQYQFTYTSGSFTDQQTNVSTDGKMVYRIQIGFMFRLI